jgi:hypothetical protein
LEKDTVFIDMRTCELTIAQVFAEVKRLQEEHPNLEIFLDGDARAIVGRRKS